MSELMSDQILARLRQDADLGARPKERNATLDRLVLACNDIAGGRARSIIKEGFPDAEAFFRRSPVYIKPPRIEEYVLARRALDVRARRTPSLWTGPMSTTIRKDTGLLDYVRTREQEQAAVTPNKVVQSIDHMLDKVDDLALRTELRIVLARAQRDQHDLRRLKDGMRRLRPTIDVDGLIRGPTNGPFPAAASQAPTLPAPDQASDRMLLTAMAFIQKITDSKFLAKFGLEYSPDVGNIVERKTRAEFISSQELTSIRAIVSPGASGGARDGFESGSGARADPA